jgi:alanine racemase
MEVKILNFETVAHPPTWCDIDLKALAHNFEQLQKLAMKNMSHALGVVPVIKADAYGHGMIQVAECLNTCGCKYWGVSNVTEGVTLRAAGFKQKILLFESTLEQDAKDIVEYQLTPTVCVLEMAQALDRCAKQAGVQLPVHIKIDTGMGRLGSMKTRRWILWRPLKINTLN